MLVKLFFKQWQAKIKSLSPARRIFLSFALVILVGSLLFESAFCPASELKSRLYRPPLYSGLHGLCDGALYPVGGFDL